MQTMSEIRAQDYERRMRAARYEVLVGEVAMLRLTISRLQDRAVDLSALTSIYKLTADVPASVLTSSTSSLAWSVPGDMVARDVIMRIAGGALALAERKEQERPAELGQTQQRLAAVETELQEFE